MNPAVNLNSPASRRNSSGAITILLMTFVVVLGICSLLMLQVQSSKLCHDRLQYCSECATLKEACVLNDNNMVGKMNDMVVNSRECVFNDRTSLKTLAVYRPDLEPLASQLLEESRQGAQFVEHDRKTLGAYCVQNAKKIMSQENHALSQSTTFGPLFTTDARAQITDVELGFLGDIDSNVAARASNSALEAIDLNKAYVNSRTNYYKGNIDMKLPIPDDDLTFKITALPARILNRPVQQPGLVDNLRFHKTFRLSEAKMNQLDQLPSAVRLTLSVQFRDANGDHNQLGFLTSETACSMGDYGEVVPR